MTGIEESTQLFSQAATLMLVGMAFVFGFLSLLIFVIKVFISPLATRYPDPTPVINKDNTNTSSCTEDSAIVAAISVAINQYRKKHK